MAIRNVTRGVGEGRESLNTQPLDGLSKTLGSIFSVELGVPQSVRDDLVKNGKKFCVGLLESPWDHAWWPSVRGLAARDRMSVSASLFLARKVLPSPPDPRQAWKHMQLMRSPAPRAPSDYVGFIERELDSLFVVGWDKGYQSHVFSHTPSSSSCLQYSRRKGGARRFLAEQGSDWFADVCLDGEEARGFPCTARYTVVQTAGKARGVTVSDGRHHVLGPLHRTLYDYLSQFGWLLRGEARGKKFRSFAKRKGEVFVSGDYESATDNLSLTVTELILSRILSRARFIPPGIKDFAMRSLRCEIFYPDLKNQSCQQERGQLMGNFLSFPLLCLHNYLAFRFSIPRDVPLRINGDDIVFRCRPQEYERWKRNVGAAGLTLSAGKTMLDGRFFSLNSAFFAAQSSGVREVPVVRLSMFLNGERPSGDVFRRAIRGWTNEGRRLVGAFWLACKSRAIQASGRSVVGGLGIPADNSQLHTAGLAPREAFFRGQRGCLAIQESPPPTAPLDHRNPACDEWIFSSRPFHSVPRERKEWDTAHREACSQVVWQPCETRPEVLWGKWWDELKSTGFESSWLSWRRTARRVHRMGLRLNIRLRTLAVPPRRGGQWVPRFELPARICLYPGLGVR